MVSCVPDEVIDYEGLIMDPLFGGIALAALGGASGELSKSAAFALWTRLKHRFANDEEIEDLLAERNPNDLAAVARLTQALYREAAADPQFRDEIEGWWARGANSIQTANMNTVQNSQGLNAPGGTFTAPITLNVGESEGRRK